MLCCGNKTVETFFSAMNGTFIKTSGLPTAPVVLAATADDKDCVGRLHELGIKTLSFYDGVLPAETAMHTDMLICHTGNDKIFAADSQDISQLQKYGFHIQKTASLGDCYPNDVKLNCAVSEKFFVCNKKTVDTSLYNYLIDLNLQPVFVNQGYTKCSVCFLRENAAITDDESVYKALRKNNTDVLFISKGDIVLSSRHYGFFGGSVGKIDENTLAITGELSYHRDKDKILSFCDKYGITVKELIKGKIRDIGGIIPLLQQK